MSEPPVVLLAVNDFPPLLGGEATLYHGLARHLPAAGTIVLAPRHAGSRPIDAALQVPVIRRWLPAHGGMISRMARGLIGGLHLAALLWRVRVRYLLCGQLLSLGVPTRLLCAVTGIPYAVFVHGADLADFHARALWGRLARRVVEGAQAVIVNSGFTAALVQRLLPGAARRTVILPIGIDRPAPVDPEAIESLRRRLGLGGGPVLLSVARLVPMKGHDVVIEALPRLLRRHPDLRYLVVGDGPGRQSLRRLAEASGVADRVVFTGAVPASELGAHYALATLFVQLSRDPGPGRGVEGFGISLLEAASHGLACIGGRSGGVPEAMQDGETGLLVTPEDAAGFAAAAERLLDDPDERRRMGAAGRRWAEGHTWERAARCLLDLAAQGGRLSCATTPGERSPS
jgi:phosphatidyl-myo-inositol dimannoside synthase